MKRQRSSCCEESPSEKLVEDVRSDLDAFKTEKRLKMCSFFKKSLTKHKQACSKQIQNMHHHPTVDHTPPKKNQATLVKIPKHFFKLRYSYFEFLQKNQIAEEQTSVTFLPYMNDEVDVEYDSYAKYYDDLGYINNLHNSHRMSDYTRFMKYYLHVMAQALYEYVIDRICVKYGDSDTILRILAEDMADDYEDEIADDIKNMSKEHVKSDRSEFILKIMEEFQIYIGHITNLKRERERKQNFGNHSLKFLWSALNKLLCYKCMKFDCPLHRDEYDTCVRDPSDARIALVYNDTLSIGRILEKLFITQNYLMKSGKLKTTPCSNNCFSNHIRNDTDTTKDWTGYDKDLALHSIFIHGETIYQRLIGKESCISKTSDYKPLRDVICQLSLIHRKPCYQMRQFLSQWFLSFKTGRLPTKNQTHASILRCLAPSFMTSEEKHSLKPQIPKVTQNQVVLESVDKPDIYNPCQCRLMDVETCTCVLNGTFCTELCNCFTKDNLFKFEKCKQFHRTCVECCSGNNLFENPMKRCAIGYSELHGLGLFALEDIKKGELVIEYVGEVVSVMEENRRSVLYDMYQSSYLFILNKTFSLDAYRKGNESRYLNDANGKVQSSSLSNNCHSKVIFDSTRKDYRVGIFALKEIKKYSELLFAYGDTFWESQER